MNRLRKNSGTSFPTVFVNVACLDKTFHHKQPEENNTLREDITYNFGYDEDLE